MSPLRSVAALALCIAGMLAPACVGPTRALGAPDPKIYAEPAPAVAAQWDEARGFVEAGDPEAAWGLLSVVVRESPDLVRAHLAYQDAALSIGGESEAEMRRYYRVELPERDSPVGPYVAARLKATSYDKGQALAEILAEHPSFGWAHLSLGRVKRGQGQFAGAVDAFTAALVNDPTLHEAYLDRARAYTALGKYARAARDYEAFLDQQPTDYLVMREYAAMLIYRIVRIDRALELLETLEARAPNDVELRMHRAAALWQAERPREALSTYVQVLELDPDSARAALNIGLIYYDAMPQNEGDEERRVWWPRARAAFRYYLARGDEAADGHEAFERVLAVPYRLERIAAVLGPAPAKAPTLDDLRLQQ